MEKFTMETGLPEKRDDVFNAACAGDKTMYLVHRLQGFPQSDFYQAFKETLLEAFGSNVQLWVIHIGQNDLDEKRKFDPLPIYTLLRLLLGRSHGKVLLTGLFHRHGVPDYYIDHVNEHYRKAVQHFGEIWGHERAQYLPPPPEFDDTPHTTVLQNGVQAINDWGDRIWITYLAIHMWKMLKDPVPRQSKPGWPKERSTTVTGTSDVSNGHQSAHPNPNPHDGPSDQKLLDVHPPNYRGGDPSVAGPSNWQSKGKSKAPDPGPFRQLNTPAPTLTFRPTSRRRAPPPPTVRASLEDSIEVIRENENEVAHATKEAKGKGKLGEYR